MAPRALLQRRASSKESLADDGEIGEDAEVSISAGADAFVESQSDEPITLQVFRGRRRILETALEMGTTVKDVKLQVERTTGIPISCQIIAFKGRPLSSSAVVACLKLDLSTVTVREADESWVQALEELSETDGGIAGTVPTGPLSVARCDAFRVGLSGFSALLSKMDQVQCTAASTTANYKRATGKVMASANLLENAAEHLQRNRAVVFEVRGSKGARKAAEDLMTCRNALLAATHSNGLVLSAEETSASMNKAFTAELLELRAALRRANELLLRRSEWLHLQRFRGGLRHEDVEQQLQQCQEELVALETDQLEKACQELMAARRNYKLAMRSNLLAIKRASEYLQQDERVVLSWALDHVSKQRTLDRDFMLTVVQSNGEALEEAAPQLQQDREVVLEALRSSKGWALQFAADELKRDRDIVLTAVRRSGLCLQFAGEMRGDRGVVLAAVQVDGEALEFASQELREDEAVVVAAIQTSRGWALQYASEALRSNKKVVLEALRENGLMLEHTSQDLQADPEIVLVAVTSNSSALQFASDKLKNNRKIVLAAVSKDGFALRFASSSMKADREVVAVAVKQAGEYVMVVADESMAEGEKFGGRLQMDTATGSPGSAFSEGFVEVSEMSWSNTGFEKTHL